METDLSAIDAVLSHSGEPDRLLPELAERSREAGAWHDLFECRLMQARIAAGLPVDCVSLSDAPADKQNALEDAYRAACVEVGEGLLSENKYSPAWQYFKAAGETSGLRGALESTEINDENAEELIEIALHEGVYPRLGYRWLLERFGTCNAVTTLDGMGQYLPPEDLRACVTELVEWISEELSESIRAHIERQEGAPPESVEIARLIEDRAWLFEHEASHVDASHLAAAVRSSRVLRDSQTLKLSVQLAGYGARLHESLRYPDAPPFNETYRAQLLYLHALLGEQVEEAVEFFRGQVEQHQDPMERPACVETYLAILMQVGRSKEALSEFGRLVVGDVQLSPEAPKPLDMARESRDWEGYEALMRSREDAIGLAAGIIAKRQQETVA